MSDALTRIFDIEPVTVVTQDNKEIVLAPDDDGNAEDADWAYARARSYELAEKGHEALDVAMRVVREAESPAAITALSGLIKTLSDTNKNLLALNREKSEAKTAKAGQSKNPSTTTIQNQQIIFTGNSKDLNSLLKAQLDNK